MKLRRLIPLTYLMALLLTGCAAQPTDAPATLFAAGAAGATALPQKSVPAASAPQAAAETLAPTAPAATPPAVSAPSPSVSDASIPTLAQRGDAPSPTPLPTLKPDEWQTLPVIPVVSDHVLEIYRRGLELGNDPNAFSKLGDCGGTPAWFLGDFDRGPRYYRLGPYTELEGVIEAFQGSFERTSLAARSGFNVSALFTPLWADKSYCASGETPLECEYRIHRPILAFIMLGTNDVWRPEEFEPQMRRAIEYSIEMGVIPVLATKADNQEGDGSINAAIAALAREYDIPLWNYWAAVNALPNHGLQEDEAHLTWGRNLFDDAEAMTKAWPVRNLTALQALDAVWRKLR